MMYEIYIEEGRCYCQGRLQDSTERWYKPTLQEAIKSMIQFAKAGNGTKITKKNITFYRAKEQTIVSWEKFRP